MGKVGFLGEMEKLIPQSPQRMRSVSVSTDDVVVELVGVAGNTSKSLFSMWIYVHRESRKFRVFSQIPNLWTVSVANMKLSVNRNMTVVM